MKMPGQKDLSRFVKFLLTFVLRIASEKNREYNTESSN